MPVTATYAPGFTSAGEALTISLTGALSASLSFSSAPSRVFTVRTPPSMLVIVARTRTGGGAACVCCIMPCAKAGWCGCIDAANSRAMAPAANAFQNVIVILPARSRIDSLNARTPVTRVLFLAWRLGRREVLFQQVPQFLGDFRLLAKPQLELWHRLTQQHA